MFPQLELNKQKRVNNMLIVIMDDDRSAWIYDLLIFFGQIIYVWSSKRRK